MQKHRMGLSFDFDDGPKPAARSCDRPGCTGTGEHRAPKGRDRLNEYFWFCLDHVREYNKAWDYYAGLSQEEIENHIRYDTTWQRPTWPMGDWRTRERQARSKVFRSDFAFGASWTGETSDESRHPPPRPPSTPEEEALAVLDLQPPVDFARIKTRYRELAKLHHPDANGGSKEAEERLKRINQAYNILKAAYGSG